MLFFGAGASSNLGYIKRAYFLPGCHPFWGIGRVGACTFPWPWSCGVSWSGKQARVLVGLGSRQCLPPRALALCALKLNTYLRFATAVHDIGSCANGRLRLISADVSSAMTVKVFFKRLTIHKNKKTKLEKRMEPVQ